MGYWLLAIGYWLLVTGYWQNKGQRTTNEQQPTTNNTSGKESQFIINLHQNYKLLSKFFLKLS